jgi:hypothetical protein
MAQSAGVRDAVAAANERFMTAFSKGDAAGLAALYTTNGDYTATSLTAANPHQGNGIR